MNDHTLSKLNSCVLVSESEQSLKSTDDYKAVLDLELKCRPPLVQYLEKFAMPAPGDWPTWYFVKKIIAHSDNTSPLNSILPEQGAFHVILNATDDAVVLFHFFFTELYQHLFGKELPTTPKPYQTSLITTAAFLGWLLIREIVLETFKLCKDVEFVMILHLLDEILPLLFYHYTVVFRSGDFENYLTIMHRFLILYICWQRRHYDKSTLSMLCDTQHQKEFFPEYYSTKQHWLTVFTEKKVEIWHSKLRSNISPSDPPTVITQRAKIISGIQHETSFQHHFVPEYQRGSSEKDHTFLAGKSAEFLIAKFQCIASNLNKIKQVSLLSKLTMLNEHSTIFHY